MQRTFVVAGMLLAVAFAGSDVPTAEPVSSPVAPISSPQSAFAITIPQLVSYQGKLTDTMGVPVPNGNYSTRFALYTQASGGSPYWQETQNVATEDGLFAVLLGSVTPIPYAPEAGNLYLGMKVGTDPEMTPRIRIVSAAYSYISRKSDTANYAAAASPTGPAGGDLAGTYPDPDIDSGAVTTSKLYDLAVTDAKLANGAVTTQKLNQMGAGTGQVLKWTGSVWAPRNDSVGGGGGGGTVTSVSQGTGVTCTPNPITTSGTVALDTGYTDGRYVNTDGDSMTGTLALQDDLRVHGKGQFGAQSSAAGNYAFAAGYRDSAIGGQSVVSGGSSNKATQGYATVGGGYLNQATALRATVGGGIQNDATANDATVAGGRFNAARGIASAVGGGNSNTASGDSATVGGGANNTASDNSATVGGGRSNTASGPWSTVGGGVGNRATYNQATVGGGNNNEASGHESTIAGGFHNIAYGPTTTVAGGWYNVALRDQATVGGGRSNRADSAYSTVSGGAANNATGWCATIGGGFSNSASGDSTTIAGGARNQAIGRFSFVGGGRANRADSSLGVVCGGDGNTAWGSSAAIVGGGANYAYYQGFVGGGWNNFAYDHSAVGGGVYNRARGFCGAVGGGHFNYADTSYATIPGGYDNTADGVYSFATNASSNVPSSRSNSAAFNGQTATASNQLRCGTLSKAGGSFTIDHPADPYGKVLNHYFVESPEMRNIYEGSVVLDASGRAEAVLPDYFSDLNRNPRVQLTGVGTSGVVYVDEDVSGNRFTIGGPPGAKVYWQVTGERKDVSAEAIRRMMPVEQPKSGDLAGAMLDDEFLAGCMDQLEREGKSSGIVFRTAAGRQRYEQMKRAIVESRRPR